jgi:hypothetical protein
MNWHFLLLIQLASETREKIVCIHGKKADIAFFTLQTSEVISSNQVYPVVH